MKLFAVVLLCLCVQAEDSRDSLAMALYAAVFRWILKKINVCINGPETYRSISVLDIFGFENFQVSVVAGTRSMGSFQWGAHVRGNVSRNKGWQFTSYRAKVNFSSACSHTYM